MLRRAIFQYIYYNESPNINVGSPYSQYNNRNRVPYSRYYDLNDYNNDIFYDNEMAMNDYPNFIEKCLHSQNKLPYGYKHRVVNHSDYRHNNAYDSMHNKKKKYFNKTDHHNKYYDNDFNKGYKKDYKERNVKEKQNVNSEETQNNYSFDLPRSTERNYKPSFISNNYNNSRTSVPMYIKVNKTSPALEQILSNRNK